MADEDPLVTRHRRENWRREWINKFCERQRTARRWIEFVEIAKWCARSTTGASIEGEQEALGLAYQRLTHSVLEREFEADDRSKVLYLDSKTLSIGAYPYRLTRDWFERSLQTAAQSEARLRIAARGESSHLPMNLLVHCWIPHDMARRWLNAHGYRCAPHLEPAQGSGATQDPEENIGPFMPTGAPGRPSKGNARNSN
jgi:hypothetical protein